MRRLLCSFHRVNSAEFWQQYRYGGYSTNGQTIVAARAKPRSGNKAACLCASFVQAVPFLIVQATSQALASTRLQAWVGSYAWSKADVGLLTRKV